MVINSVIIALLSGYIISVICSIISIVGLKKVKKEFGESNNEPSEMERKKRRPYVVIRLIGYILPTITSIILLFVLYKMV